MFFLTWIFPEDAVFDLRRKHMEGRQDPLLFGQSVKGGMGMADKGQKMAIEDHSEQGITNTMVTALEEEQFSVCFQPKYDLRSGCMIGAEALVRWNHPEWGCVDPEEFIPLFEKNECIFQMDQYVWEQACVQLREWKEKGYQLLPVSVNVSRVDLFRENLVDTLLGFTQKHGIDPSYLHLEITESAYIENPLQIAGTVEELRKRILFTEYVQSDENGHSETGYEVRPE